MHSNCHTNVATQVKEQPLVVPVVIDVVFDLSACNRLFASGAAAIRTVTTANILETASLNESGHSADLNLTRRRSSIILEPWNRMLP